MAQERARRIADQATIHERHQGELDDLAERLWRALTQTEDPQATFLAGTPEGIATWRRVAAEAARWASEDDDDAGRSG